MEKEKERLEEWLWQLGEINRKNMLSVEFSDGFRYVILFDNNPVVGKILDSAVAITKERLKEIEENLAYGKGKN